MRETKILTICLLLFTSQVFADQITWSDDHVKGINEFEKIVDIFCTFKTVFTENGPLARKQNINFSSGKEKKCAEEKDHSVCEDRIKIFASPGRGRFRVYINGVETKNYFRYSNSNYNNMRIDGQNIKFTESDINVWRSSKTYEISRVSGKVKKTKVYYGFTPQELRKRNDHLKSLYEEERKWWVREDFKRPWDEERDEILLGAEATKIFHSSYYYGKCIKNKKNLF